MKRLNEGTEDKKERWRRFWRKCSRKRGGYEIINYKGITTRTKAKRKIHKRRTSTEIDDKYKNT